MFTRTTQQGRLYRQIAFNAEASRAALWQTAAHQTRISFSAWLRQAAEAKFQAEVPDGGKTWLAAESSLSDALRTAEERPKWPRAPYDRLERDANAAAGVRCQTPVPLKERVLFALTDEWRSRNELVDELGTTRSYVSKLLNELYREGLVENSGNGLGGRGRKNLWRRAPRPDVSAIAGSWAPMIAVQRV